jgi:hypothetical protein
LEINLALEEKTLHQKALPFLVPSEKFYLVQFQFDFPETLVTGEDTFILQHNSHKISIYLKNLPVALQEEIQLSRRKAKDAMYDLAQEIQYSRSDTESDLNTLQSLIDALYKDPTKDQISYTHHYSHTTFLNIKIEPVPES